MSAYSVRTVLQGPRDHVGASRKMPATSHSRVLVLRPQENRALRRHQVQAMRLASVKKEKDAFSRQDLLQYFG